MNPYVQPWSLSVQRELPGRIVVETGYVGNRGTNFNVAREWNPVPAHYLSTSPVRDQATIDFLSAQVRSPFAGMPEFSGAALANNQVNRSQIVNAVYELPVGRGKPLLGDARGVLNHLIGGWQVQGIFEGQSGAPLGFGNAIYFGNLHDIPLPVSQRMAERWFNTEAGFERDPRKQLGSNIRAFPTRFSGIRRDGINAWDLSVFKNFRITERWKAQFRAEANNALNHVMFAAPNTTPSSSAFGTITAETGHGPRRVDFGIKLIF